MGLIIDWIPKADMAEMAELLAVLNEGKTAEDMLPIIAELQKLNYKCVGVRTEGRLIGLCGVWPLYKHYIGKHLEVDNVVIHTDFRGQNIGEKMLQFVADWGEKEEYKVIELNAYVENEAAHRFWERIGFRKLGFHMRKELG